MAAELPAPTEIWERAMSGIVEMDGVKVRVYTPRTILEQVKNGKAPVYYSIEDVFDLVNFFPTKGAGRFGALRALFARVNEHPALKETNLRATFQGYKPCRFYPSQTIYDAIEAAVKDSPQRQAEFWGFEWADLATITFDLYYDRAHKRLKAMDKEIEEKTEKRTRMEAFLTDLQEDKVPCSKRARLSKD